jgi:hypothetical protein
MTGPAKSTIIEVINTPARVDTKVKAARTAPAPIAANSTPNQYTVLLLEKEPSDCAVLA